MADEKKLTRGQFMTRLGGVILSAVAVHFSSTTSLFTSAAATPESEAGSYGNSTYGGKKN